MPCVKAWNRAMFIKSVRVACAYEENDVTDRRIMRGGLYIESVCQCGNNPHRLGSGWKFSDAVAEWGIYIRNELIELQTTMDVFLITLAGLVADVSVFS